MSPSHLGKSYTEMFSGASLSYKMLITIKSSKCPHFTTKKSPYLSYMEMLTSFQSNGTHQQSKIKNEREREPHFKRGLVSEYCNLSINQTETGKFPSSTTHLKTL